MKKAILICFNLFIFLCCWLLFTATTRPAVIKINETDTRNSQRFAFTAGTSEENHSPSYSSDKKLKKESLNEIIFIICFTSISTFLIYIIPLSCIYPYYLKKEKTDNKRSVLETKINKQRQPYTPTPEDKKLVARAQKRIVDEKLYCNPDLTLDMLASQLQVTRNTLSRAINHTTGKNFKKYINEYRVKEAIRLLSMPENQNLTLDGIIELAGFNSRSPFYETFKSVTGHTPAEYLRLSKKKNSKKQSAT